MAKRTGVYSLRKVAILMCRLLLKFEPVIRSTWPSNTALQAALTAASAACHTLRIELDAVREIGV